MAEITAQFPPKLKPLFQQQRYKVLHGGRGGAKCLAIGTRVIMYDGTLRAVEDVSVGDAVMGPDSKPRKVLATTRGTGQLWVVKQTSAIDYVVNDDHILSVMKRKTCASDYRINKHGNARSPNGRYPSWPEITNIGVRDFAAQSKRWRESFRGYRAGVLNFPEQEVRIDPYFLGVWLGDGTSRELRITTEDSEIMDYCHDLAGKFGGVATINGKSESSAKDVGFRISAGRKNPLWGEFVGYGLRNNKHIPQAFLSNTERSRLSLLAGIIDTDGSVHNNGYVIAQVNERLARDIKYLADGLGFRTSINKRKTICTNNGVNGFAWYVSISGETWRVPCLIPRKQIKKEDVRKNKDFLLSQISIEPCGEGEWAGFTIDGDHLFLLEDGTVTHNSWSVVRALLIKAASEPLRILCTREVQKSIKESVHQLIKDQIQALGLGAFFQVLDTEIRGLNGSKFAFAGLASHTAESIKSYEGYDLVWVEEAQAVSKVSWDILTPTIRKPGSEIWLTLNPVDEQDETYQRFIINPPDNAWVCQINYNDNPWFPDVLDLERRQCERDRPTDYPNIWLGEPKSHAEGAYYAQDMTALVARGGIMKVPVLDIPVNTFWDIGNSDGCAIWFHQDIHGEDRFIGYFEAHGEDLRFYAKELRARGHLYGRHFFPHDASHKRLSDYNRSTLEMMQDLLPGERFEIVPRITQLMTGIQATRKHLKGAYFDETLCADGIKRLNGYRKSWNTKDLRYRDDVPDKSNGCSEGADALRQWAQAKELGMLASSTGYVYEEAPPPDWRT